MFEPQGTGFFLLLLVVFGGLLVWVTLARQLVFRIFAGCLAFLPAMVFGVAAVNKFCDYYQTWGGMINDLTAARTAAARKPEEERKQAHQAEQAPARTPAAARKR